MGTNNSIGWKAMVETFPLVGEWTAWKVGNNKSIIIGEESWVKSGLGYQLSRELIYELHDQGIYSLWDARIE
jgi:hypothetical protein